MVSTGFKAKSDGLFSPLFAYDWFVMISYDRLLVKVSAHILCLL